ncbi:MAG TPA: hypothetical protein VEB22_02460 [Phycisphaerales bacterium]|nr:hypothetical protein [Phycisphaerales bacterium]
MNRDTRTILIATLAGLVAVCLAAALHAQPGLQKAEPPKAEPAPEAVLGGPKLTVKPTRPTLVARGADGTLIRLEERPEAAAIPLLKLDGEAKKAAEKVLAAHEAEVARCLSEHHGLFLQIQSGRQGGDQRAAVPLIRELRQKAPQLWEPPLLDRLAKALPVEKAVLLRTVVNEYLTEFSREGGPNEPSRGPLTETRRGGAGAEPMSDGSMMGEGMMTCDQPGATPVPAPAPLDDPQVRRRVDNALVIRELARSLKTLTAMRKDQTERLLAGLDLTPEQDANVRAMIRETGAKSKGGYPSREDHQALIEGVRKLLTPEQAKQLEQNLKNR